MKQQPDYYEEYDDSTVLRPQYAQELAKASEISRNRRKKTVLVVIMAIILLFSLIVDIGLARRLESEDDELDFWQNKYREVSEENGKMSAQCRFYDDHVRIIPDDGSNLYHKYGCSKLDKSNGYWIYNEEAAQHRASPCPACCN